MPRQRQRIVFCDCFDCRDRPEVSLTSEQLDAATAVARQEPPPKALLLYTTGFVVAADGETNLDSCTLPHCNLLVREGNLGLLAVRNHPREATASEPAPAVSELAQLLGVYAEVASGQPHLGAADACLPSLAARFKGMQAAFASSSASARKVAQRLDMAVVDRLSLLLKGAGSAEGSGGAAPEAAAATAAAADVKPAKSALRLPDAATFARALAEELGAAEGSSGRDLLLLHLDLDDLMGPRPGTGTGAEGATAAADAAVDAEADSLWNAACEGLEWLDALVKGLLALPEIRERTLLVAMLSPAGQKMPPVPGQGTSLLQPGGAQLDPSAVVVTPRSVAQLGRGGAAAAAVAAAGAAGALSVLDSAEYPLVSRPVQSFELLGMARVETDLHAPVLVARRLPGVVRRDRAERLGYKEALTAGGMGTILVDRLLPDVAYKIGRAPKYGA